MDSATRRQRAISAVWIWVSVPTTWAPVSQTTAATVFSCVASRNKRGMLAIRRIARAGRLPLGRPANSRCSLRSARASDPPKISALSPHKAVKFDFSPFLSISGCALRGWAERPNAQARRPFGSQELHPSLSGSSSAHSNSPLNAQLKSLDFDLSLIPV